MLGDNICAVYYREEDMHYIWFEKYADSTKTQNTYYILMGCKHIPCYKHVLDKGVLYYV